jgi:hypothetical protein
VRRQRLQNNKREKEKEKERKEMYLRNLPLH